MTAFRATFSDMRLVKTRQVAQLIFEIPLSDFDAAYEVLGGLPDSSKERWFGIAAIQPVPPAIAPASSGQVTSKPDRAKREKQSWRDTLPANQAGIRCDDPIFIAFLKEQRPDDWREAPGAAECVRLICGVQSRTELGSNHKARVIWHQLDEQFSAWKAMENA